MCAVLASSFHARLKLLVVFAVLAVISGRATATDIWHAAAQRAGVSVKIIHGIALTESGKTWADGKRRPWPWTLNSAKGTMYFASKGEAADALRKLLEQGLSNIDVGLMQVNLGYHRSRVKNPEDLLDPATNLMVMADIFSEELNSAGGDLALAVGAYHTGRGNSKSERATWYQNTVAAFIRRLHPQRAAS